MKSIHQSSIISILLLALSGLLFGQNIEDSSLKKHSIKLSEKELIERISIPNTDEAQPDYFTLISDQQKLLSYAKQAFLSRQYKDAYLLAKLHRYNPDNNTFEREFYTIAYWSYKKCYKRFRFADSRTQELWFGPELHFMSRWFIDRNQGKPREEVNAEATLFFRAMPYSFHQRFVAMNHSYSESDRFPPSRALEDNGLIYKVSLEETD